LHQEHAGIGESALEKGRRKKSEGPKIFLIAKEGAIGDAAAHKEYGNVCGDELDEGS